jgi:hypothetical protein
LIIVDLVQRSILLPGRMQKTPSARPDYNIFLILRGKPTNRIYQIQFFQFLGSFYAKHVSDIESDTSK